MPITSIPRARPATVSDLSAAARRGAVAVARRVRCLGRRHACRVSAVGARTAGPRRPRRPCPHPDSSHRRTRHRALASWRPSVIGRGDAAGRADTAGAALPAVAWRSRAAGVRAGRPGWTVAVDGRGRRLGVGPGRWPAASRARTCRARTRAGWVVVATALVLGAAAYRLAPGAMYPGGDEPHYLVVTQSVLTDRDLRIDDNHARGDYRAYFQRRPQARSHRAARRRRRHLLDSPRRRVAAGRAGLCAWRLSWGQPDHRAVWRARRAAAVAVAARADGSRRQRHLDGWPSSRSAPFVLHGFAVYPGDPGGAGRADRAGLASGHGRDAGDFRRSRPGAGRAAVAGHEVRADGAGRLACCWRCARRRIARAWSRSPAPAVLLVVAWLAWFCVAVGHAVADRALRHRAPDGAVAPGGGIAGTLLRSGVRHRRGRAGAGDGVGGLVASLAARCGRPHASSSRRRCRC